MKPFLGAILLIIAALGWSGCSKRAAESHARVDVLVVGDVSNPLSLERTSSTNWFARQTQLVESDAVLGAVVDQWKLTQRWSVSKPQAIVQLRQRVTVNPLPGPRAVQPGIRDTDPVGLAITVTAGEGEAEDLAEAIAKSFKKTADADAVSQIDARLAGEQKELQQIQEKYNALKEELQLAQTNLFVFRMSKQFEAELQAKIQSAATEESERAKQLEALRQLKGAELQAALLKIEMARLAQPAVATNESASTSVLMTRNQAQRAAQKELELAEGGTLPETNALAHAQLKLEQANRNLADSIDAYLKSLDIEYEVAKGRRRELEAQAEKLRETSRRSERKQALEQEINKLNVRMTELTGEIERLKVSQRILTDTIRIGDTRVERARR
jgi:hypothetical protein